MIFCVWVELLKVIYILKAGMKVSIVEKQQHKIKYGKSAKYESLSVFVYKCNINVLYLKS